MCQGCSLGLETVSRRSFQTSRSRLGLMETWEGLGLGLVSDWKSNVSVSSRSRTIGSRLQANMHSFLLRCKISRTSFWMQGVYILYWFTTFVSERSRSPYAIARPSDVCRLERSSTLLRRLQFSAIFLWHLVPWPSVDINRKFYGDRLRGTPPSGELNTRGVAKQRFWTYRRLYLGNDAL